MSEDRVNILLVDDQPAKLLTYRTILEDVGENLLSASNATEALELLLRHDVAVVLIDVYMPDIDGFQLAAMIRNHPRFEKTALIFISAILLTDVDRLRGYEMGAVDYVPVPVIPEVLRSESQSFRRTFPQDAPAGATEQRTRGARCRAHRRTRLLHITASAKRTDAQPRACRRPDGQLGMEYIARLGPLGSRSVRDFRGRPEYVCSDARECAATHQS
jgi:CheY-like chemotaxis protein